MKDILALAATAVWICCNLYLWSMKQSHELLFLQSLGMAAISYPALYWYVTSGERPTRA